MGYSVRPSAESTGPPAVADRAGAPSSSAPARPRDLVTVATMSRGTVRGSTDAARRSPSSSSVRTGSGRRPYTVISAIRPVVQNAGTAVAPTIAAVSQARGAGARPSSATEAPHARAIIAVD